MNLPRASIREILDELISDFDLSIDENFYCKLLDIFFHAGYEYQDMSEFIESLTENISE